MSAERKLELRIGPDIQEDALPEMLLMEGQNPVRFGLPEGDHVLGFRFPLTC